MAISFYGNRTAMLIIASAGAIQFTQKCSIATTEIIEPGHFGYSLGSADGNAGISCHSRKSMKQISKI
jgi:hypothetical protein